MEKRATTLELFFDLVFVLAITQVVSFVVHDLTFTGFSKGALLMALLWWAWTQYTWAGNAIDLDPRPVRISIIVAMAVAFIMAQAVPTAFAGGGIWVGLAYVALRAVGVWKMLTGVWDDPVRRAAVMNFALFASVGPVVVLIGGLVDDPARSWIWLAGFALEIVAVYFVNTRGTEAGDWGIQAVHFTERHGLILIVALGETIVAVGLGLSGRLPSADTAALLTVALAGSAVLWWSYFDWIQDRLEAALAFSGGRGDIARDVFSVLHYPIISGVVLYAVAAEEAFSHADDPLEPAGLIALALSIMLFFGGTMAALYRAERIILWDRVVGLLVAGAVIWIGADLRGVWLIAVVMAILLAALVLEDRGRRGRALEPGSMEGVAQ